MKQVMHVFAYDTYDDMINSDDLHTNCLVFTLGKETPGDGGGNIYYLLENQRVNKYTSVGDLLKNDNNFRASRIGLAPEITILRAVEDAIYSTRGLVNSNSNANDERFNTLSKMVDESKGHNDELYHDIAEEVNSTMIIMNDKIEELQTRLEEMEKKLAKYEKEENKTSHTEESGSGVSE